jgi:hypothetical protein
VSRKGKGKKGSWQKQTLRLKDKHTWTAPPGFLIIVLDRGAVRFNYPEGWEVAPDEDAIKIYDRPKPDDNCVLAVSYLRLPPIDWSGLPLSQLIQEASVGDTRGVLPHGEIVAEPRADVEIVWRQMIFDDPVEHRPAYSRIALARGNNIQALITFDFWIEDEEKLEPAWREVLRSIELGRYVADPTRGDVLH